MRVLIEFLSDEPLENFITALNYDVDKILYFGYKDMVDRLEKEMRQFAASDKFGLGLSGKNVTFYNLKPYDFTGIIKTIYDVTMDVDGDIFFDLTGGDDLVLVAFGRVAEKIDAPLYSYDFFNDMLVEIHRPEGRDSLLDYIKEEPVQLGFTGLSFLYHWRTNDGKDKEFKSSDDYDFLLDVEKLWSLEKKYGKNWNLFLKNIDENPTNAFFDVEYLDIVADLVDEGLLVKNADLANGYSYKNNKVGSCMKEDGSVLEIITYRTMLDEGYDARVGVHSDWRGSSVNNEIDVMAIKNNIPTFISCKAGNVTDTQIYELDSLAKRLCGKYAKKMVALAIEPSAGLVKCANERGIEVWIVDKGYLTYEDEVDVEDETYED